MPNIIAHRGGRKWAPENTMVAFRKAIDWGVYGIELDVHRLKTGEIVVIHDDNVVRTTDGAGLIKDLSYRDARSLSAGLWFGEDFVGERIPLLEEVLDLADGQVVLNIEIKNAPIEYPGIELDLIKLLSQYSYPERIIISSFDHKVLSKLHKRAPHFALAILAEAIFVNIESYAKQVGATLWHPAFDCLRDYDVDEAHKAGLKVNAWTMNDPHQWSAGLEMGLNGIVTDDPKALTEFLLKKGDTKS